MIGVKALRLGIAGRLLCCALALSACSKGDDIGTTPVLEAVKVAKGMFASGKATGADGPARPSRADLDASKEPLLFGVVEKISGASTLRKARSNQGYDTWASADLLTVTLKQGVLAETRGLIGDLLSADVDPVLAALRAGGSAGYSRSLRTIGGDREIRLSRLNCTMESVGSESIDIVEVSHAVRHYAETCNDTGGGTIRNDYWLGGDGTMWQSRQFVHPVTGYITIQTLRK